MGHIKSAVATAVAAVLLSTGAAGAALAHETTPDPTAPCASQTAQVAKAEEALARLTAKFERTHVALVDAQAALAAAKTPREKAAARKLVRLAQLAELVVGKAKKAQQQRLSKAEQRLATCLAAVPVDPPVEEEPPVVP